MAELERRVGVLESSHDLLVRLEERIEGMRDDVAEVKAAVSRQESALDGERSSRERQRESDKKQAKTDRYLLIGSILTATTCIIAAVGLIVGNLH